MGLMDWLGGGQKQSSSSRPLGVGGARDYYTGFAEYVGRPQPGEPTEELGPFRSLSGEDYQRLEEMLPQTATRRLMEDRETKRNQFMAEMRKRGVADEPTAYKLQEETIDTPYTRAQADLYSNAAAQRYGLQAEELGRGQTYDIAKYAMPRDYWLNKMKTAYGGMGTVQESSGTVKPGAMEQFLKFNKAMNEGSQAFSNIGGSIGSMMSDARLKRNLKLLGNYDGMPLYEFEYLWSPARYVGFMAQDVAKKKPDAVFSVNGFLGIDYGKLF